MASAEDIQAAGDSANTLQVYTITNSVTIDGTYNAHYCVGIQKYAGRSMWVRTLPAGGAATENGQILFALNAGPCDPNALGD